MLRTEKEEVEVAEVVEFVETQRKKHGFGAYIHKWTDKEKHTDE